MLTLLPTRPEPMRAEPARGELLHLWDGRGLEGRRLVLANARAVAEVTGRVRPEPRSAAMPAWPPGRRIC
ncbi:hypothetical protein [Muricoccus radiodurans]|uniref:hypothetical protein n=1 Tax=Muricoccus radiodurans TaxID=2231721 RepID=UPI003CF61CB9